jgi:hypothetical protein
VARIALGVVGFAGTLRPVEFPANDGNFGGRVRTNSGMVSGSFSIAVPLTHSWPVAPQAQQSAAAPVAKTAARATIRPKFILASAPYGGNIPAQYDRFEGGHESSGFGRCVA